MAARIRGVGLALILLGIGWYGIWFRWDSTRNWKPVDMPVSLAPGHLRTPEFEINLRSAYRIDFAATSGFGHLEGSNYQYCLPNLGISWMLSHRGRVIAQGARQDCDGLGKFEADSGKYVLDVWVPRDGRAFNNRGPRLTIGEFGGLREDSSNQGFLAYWNLIMLTLLGVAAIVCFELRRRYAKFDSAFRDWPLTLPGSRPSPRLTGVRARLGAFVVRRPAAVPRPLTSLSSISLVVVFALPLPTILLWITANPHMIPVGFKVRLMSADVIGRPSPGIQPILVQVTLGQPLVRGQSRSEPGIYVNRRLVSGSDLETVLQKELNLRPPKWPVYLEGDSNMEWKRAVDVIAVVHNLHAQVVLLTPKRH